MKKIPLTQNKFVLVDDEDFEHLSQFKWQYHHGYAVRAIHLSGSYSKGTQKTGEIYMHRLLNNTPEGFDTDHIDRNRLNNQKSTLRTVNRSLNNLNTNLRKDNKSGYKGVAWNKFHQKWQASISLNKKSIHLGFYDEINIAWLARRWGERAYYGS